MDMLAITQKVFSVRACIDARGVNNSAKRYKKLSEKRHERANLLTISHLIAK
jgi:hypothetical protein